MAGNYFDSFRRGGMFYGLSRSLDPATPEGAEARNYLRDAVMERVNAARGMFGAGVELATNRNTLAEALARQPKPFTEESAKNAQTMAEGFWNPAGLLGGAMGVTKFEKAHKVAQKNAAKPVERGGLGLPKDNTAADRAKALGYDTDAYHGGTNDFREFFGTRPTYASDEPRIADIYAVAEGRHRGLREINAAPNVMPLKLRGKEVAVSDLGDNGGGWYMDNLAERLGIPAKRGMVNEIGKQGFDRLKVTDMTDLGGVQSQYMIPAGSPNIRSRFAAFDPARKHEADLLAGYFGFQLPQFEERK